MNKQQTSFVCPVCGASNNALAIQCSACHSYLQNRVPNIDFFQTVWHLLERPQQTFKTIALAEHKNYSLILFIFFGIFVSFNAFSIFTAGRNEENLVVLLSKIFSVGILLGILFLVLLPLVHKVLATIVQGRGKYRNAFSLLAYASMPLLCATVFLIPIKLLSFGMYYFTANPHPVVLNAPLYWILNALDGVAILWYIILLTIGTKITYQISTIRSLFINFLTFFLLFGIVYYSGRYVIQ